MKLRVVILITAFCVIAGYSDAQSSSTGSSSAPYTEGAVWDITMVKTKPGLDDDYLKSIAQTVERRHVFVFDHQQNIEVIAIR